MKRLFLMITVMLVTLTGCHKDPQEPEVSKDLFCITALEPGLEITMNQKVADDITPPVVLLQYSSDGTNWEDFIVGQSVVSLSKIGDKVYFKAKNVNTTFACTASDEDNVSANMFSMNKKAKVGGNIMYLLNGNDPSAAKMATYTFSCLFHGDTNLVDASELVLPATSLMQGAYSLMFKNCNSLQFAPALPATNLAKRCYQSMFEGCHSLVNAPALPATTLAELCYQGMFIECSHLKSAPVLQATTLAKGCYWAMFYECAQLESAPALPATTLADQCYTAMFWNCSQLTEAPELLPALTVENYSYNGMFWGCTSLTQAPAIQATQLSNNSCSGMFQGCSSLVNGPVLNTTTLSEQCYRIMFKGCTSLTNLTCKATDMSASDCLLNWMEGITTNGILYAMPGTEWLGIIPSSWKVEYLSE